MIRSWVKTGAAEALSRSGTDRMIAALSRARSPLVIGYHRVVEDFTSNAQTSIPAMLVSRRMLEQQLDWIGRHFRFISLDELGATLETRGELDEPVAAVTFDDGYRDFYEVAFPVLRARDIPAAVFVTTSLVGTKKLHIHDELYLLLAQRFGRGDFASDDLAWFLQPFGVRLPSTAGRSPFAVTRLLLEYSPQTRLRAIVEGLRSEVSIPEAALEPFYVLTWEMVEEVHRAGITVGSHTHTHIVMTRESRNQSVDEAVESRWALQSRLGTPIRHFAYPDGKFNRTAVRAVAAAGYRFGYTTCRHRDSGYPLLTLPRMLFWERSCQSYNGTFSGSILACQTHQVFGFGSRCRQYHGVS